MIPKNKLKLIVFICVLISCFCYDKAAYAQKAKSTQKAISVSKATSVPKVKSTRKAKSAKKATSAPKAISTQKAKSAQKTASTHNDWMLTGYGAMLSPDTLGDTLTFNAKYEDSYIAVLSVSKRIYSFQKAPIDIEMEGQVAKHFGKQNHFEVNVVPLVIRWNRFPWDKYVDTSFAAGAGVSYAFEKPDIEEDSVGDDHSSPKLLGYLMCEFAFSLPSKPQWSFVTRVHHRSGANGLFDGRLDASNAVGFGIKYMF